MTALALDDIEQLVRDALTANGYDEPNCAAIVSTVVRAERDGSSSHGLFRVPGYVAGIRSGSVNGRARPSVASSSPGTMVIDAAGGAAPLALAAMFEPLTTAARAQGIALCAIRNVNHFAALWPEVEALAENGLCAIATTAALPYVAPTGGTTALFGTNPIAFAWPRPGGVYAFDMATAAMARGDISLAARDGRAVPEGVGLDADGHPTTDPAAILDGGVQLAAGGHKGSALALMVELLAASLIGERFSYEAADDYPGVGPPGGGELVIAIDPSHTGALDWQRHAEGLFTQIEAMPGARLAGARRHERRASTDPVEFPQELLDEIRDFTINPQPPLGVRHHP